MGSGGRAGSEGVPPPFESVGPVIDAMANVENGVYDEESFCDLNVSFSHNQHDRE